LFFDSFLFSCAKQNCTDPLADCACANEAINHDFFLCLVNPCGHWLLVMVNLLTQHCYAIDSLLQNIQKFSGIFNNIKKIISSCYAIAGRENDVTMWKFSVCRDVPKQPNLYDCGIHATVNGFCIVNELPLPEKIPSELARTWVRRTFCNFNEQVLQKPKTKDGLQPRNAVNRAWICNPVQIHFVEKELTQCVQHFVVHNKSQWCVCDASAWHGNMGDELQVLFATCRKWFHTKCLPGNVTSKYSDTYFKCTSFAKK